MTVIVRRISASFPWPWPLITHFSWSRTAEVTGPLSFVYLFSLSRVFLHRLPNFFEEFLLGNKKWFISSCLTHLALCLEIIWRKKPEPEYPFKTHLIVWFQRPPGQFFEVVCSNFRIESREVFEYGWCLLHVYVDRFHEILVAIEADRAMRVIVVLHSHIERLEVALNFSLGQKVNPIEQDGVVADLDVGVGRDDYLPSFNVVAVLFEREAVEELHKSASQDIILFLLGTGHGPLDFGAEGLPFLVGGCGSWLLDLADSRGGVWGNGVAHAN